MQLLLSKVAQRPMLDTYHTHFVFVANAYKGRPNVNQLQGCSKVPGFKQQPVGLLYHFDTCIFTSFCKTIHNVSCLLHCKVW